MTIPADLVKVVFTADLWHGAAPQEEAVFGFSGHRVHSPPNVTSWASDTQFLADKMRDKFVARLGTIKAAFSPSMHMRTVKCYHLGTDGKTIDVGTSAFDGTNAFNGAGANGLPWQDALVVTLYGYPYGTYVPNGSRRRGRFYLPPLSVAQLTPDGEVETGHLSDITVAVGLWLNDVQGTEFPGTVPVDGTADYFDLGVLSRVGAGSFSPAPALSIDAKIDTQRRRARKEQAEKQSYGIDHS